MNDILLPQVAMEANAMPPPASSTSRNKGELSDDASFDRKLEKAMNEQPDEECLALATEAVVVPMQTPENQPRFDDETVQSLETETQALAQKLYAMVEEQVKQVQPALASIISSDPSAEEGAGTQQTVQADLPEALANAMTKQEAAPEIPVLLKAADQQLATVVAQSQTNKADSATTAEVQTSETTPASSTSSNSEQTVEKPSIDLLGALKVTGETKGEPSIKVSSDVNHPIQADTAETAATQNSNGKTAYVAENTEIKIDLVKVSDSTRQSAQAANAQASTEPAEITQTIAVTDNAGTVQAPISESRKVKASLEKMEGESPGHVTSGNRAVQSLDAQVKEPARLAEAQTPEMINQIAKSIDLLSRSDGQSLRIQLQPENLGKIEIRLTSRADGVSVTLNTDIPLTGSLLERNLSELRTSLADAGVNLASLSVNSGQKQATYQESKQWYSGKDSQNNYSNQNIAIEDLPSVKSTWKDSAIDYRI